MASLTASRAALLAAWTKAAFRSSTRTRSSAGLRASAKAREAREVSMSRRRSAQAVTGSFPAAVLLLFSGSR
eukprot:CAMPEP_0119529746 /NCGR_PEP_ID=MMETSP1344-20130328/43701_1 /TAXON_ID=236787 /ORGANISM="Florenciella parvula, Strain CCMP2471" /LENGTH=71 /DNA_ID=CAMNT_0007569455 /DNA_START=228 /DNA_END=440 /DNA_ORIENTATION=-